MDDKSDKVGRGYTIVELMVTLCIVTILATSLGVFFSKLLTIQEKEREDAYIRESLAEVCAAYADFLSIGSSISTNANHEMYVKYRQEAGGVSFETGRVTRAAYLYSGTNTAMGFLDMKVFSGDFEERFKRWLRGDASLIPVAGDKLVYKITPLNVPLWQNDREFSGFRNMTNALYLLQVTASYKFKDEDGKMVETNATAGRVVRLWNID